MLARGPAVQLVDADLLATQVVWVPCVVLDVETEVGALLRLLKSGQGRI